MLIAFFCQNEDGKSLTLHILDSIASFLPHLLRCICQWISVSESSVRIPSENFLLLEWLQGVHIPQLLLLLTSFAKTWNLGICNGMLKYT